MTGVHKAAGSVAVLATCFNRRDITVNALASLRASAAGVDYKVYLVDDGSTDGTGDAVRSLFPEASVIRGDGSLYWNAGMRMAWQAAIPGGHSYYLLLNDDLDLLPGGISALMKFQKRMEEEHGPKVVTIGKVLDIDSDRVTYGGYVTAPGLSRLRFSRVPDDGRPCDTTNGNCVLIPARAVDDVGILSDRYRHYFGDIDYGLRARNAGYKLFQSPEAVGRTEFNSAAYAKKPLTWNNRAFILKHPKGLSLHEWFHFCRTHGGALWPVNFLIRYVKLLSLSSR